jgi:Ca-activated chloride channel family protein
MPAKIHVERMMYRNSIAVPGDSAASYALVKLIPTGEGANVPLPLNLALVLDISGSMYEEDGTGKSRLLRIQEAAHTAIQKLRPEDTLAIVAFGADARVLLPATSLLEKERIEEVVDRIDRYDVDPAGTAMDEGIRLGLAEVEKSADAGRLSQVVVLTDGETSGETICRQLAQQAAEKHIHFTVMGIGTEWNASLLKDLARLAEGKWYYIDESEKEGAERIFLEEFGRMASAGFTNVELHLWPVKDVRVKRARQVVPEIKELNLSETDERHLIASLGTLEFDKTSRYILDLSLPKRPDGNYVILQMDVSYALGGGRRESTGKVPLQIQYTRICNRRSSRTIRPRPSAWRRRSPRRASCSAGAPPRRPCWPARCFKNSTPAAGFPRRRSWPSTTRPGWRRRCRYPAKTMSFVLLLLLLLLLLSHTRTTSARVQENKSKSRSKSKKTPNEGEDHVKVSILSL